MHRAALSALATARPALSRLDRSRSPQELCADIAGAWKGTETAVRALLGGSMMSGVTLIHEARARHMLSFEQANALAAFHAASARCADAGYAPTEADISAARVGFEQLESSLTSATAPPPHLTPGEAMSTKGLRLSPLGTPRPVPLPRERQPVWFLVVLVAGILVVAGGAAWLLYTRGGGSLENRAVAAFEAGRRDIASGLFEQVVAAEPKNVRGHIYLSRLARESGDLKGARDHAALAVNADPRSAPAQREMASALLASRDHELARRFYIRALEIDPDDRVAQGFLGCALLQLGRVDEGNRWLTRAGSGPWSTCAAPPSSPIQGRAR